MDDFEALNKTTELLADASLWIVGLVNSSFGTALLGALFGAGAANYFAQRAERKSALMRRLQASNAATAMARAIFQHALGLKEHLTQPEIDKFKSDKNRFISFLSRTDGEDNHFHVEYNFRSFDMFQHNAEEIEKIVLSNGSLDPKTTMASTFLVQTLNSLSKLIAQRKIEIERLSSEIKRLSDEQFSQIYFGVRDNDGNIDERYSDAMLGIELQLDSSIFYAKFIVEDLAKQNEELSRKLGKDAPRPIKFVFDSVNYGHLLPNPDEFPDWTN
jgi:hypothetical protein